MKTFRTGLMLSIITIVLCGIIYPIAITGIGGVFFKDKANGSMILYKGKAVGSSLLGQNFTDPRFFRGRVSSINYNTYTAKDTKPDKNGKVAYSGVGSGSQNLGPSSSALKDRVKNDIADFLKTHPGVKKSDIPTDLLTSSASGLDPDVSPQGAKIQIPAVSKATGISEKTLQKMVNEYTEGKTLEMFGEPRVNVLKLNLEIANMLKLNVK
ncbi:MAG: potassium-transporting ATPase subunit KdpC [Clostridium sp.]|nr:potassium-transporting ATPase subunit KdpC [Clostridium sp.]